MKTCATCKKELPDEMFKRDKGKKSGLHSWCRPCAKIYAHEYHKCPENKRRIENARLVSLYGITLTEKRTMIDEQGKACKVCGSPFSDTKQIHVDHCHDTGRVRGILCHGCNTAIGLLNNEISRFRSCVRYLSTGGYDGIR